MTRREQDLVDQMDAWRAEIDARPEKPMGAKRDPLPSAEERRQRILDRRAKRIAGKTIESSMPAPERPKRRNSGTTRDEPGNTVRGPYRRNNAGEWTRA